MIESTLSFPTVFLMSATFLSSSSRVAQKREDAVSKEVTRKLSEADNRKMSRKEKDERWNMRRLVPHRTACLWLDAVVSQLALAN